MWQIWQMWLAVPFRELCLVLAAASLHCEEERRIAAKRKNLDIRNYFSKKPESHLKSNSLIKSVRHNNVTGYARKYYMPTLPIFPGESRISVPLPKISRSHHSPQFLPISHPVPDNKTEKPCPRLAHPIPVSNNGYYYCSYLALILLVLIFLGREINF